MAQLTLQIPDNIYDEMENINQNLVNEIFRIGLLEFKINQALELYKKGDISFGRAAEIAGIREDELSIRAQAHGLFPEYSDLTLEEELE